MLYLVRHAPGRGGGWRESVDMALTGAAFGVATLVWFEAHADFETSLLRERRLKRWRRAWKDALIMEHNPQWRDITHLVPE